MRSDAPINCGIVYSDLLQSVNVQFRNYHYLRVQKLTSWHQDQTFHKLFKACNENTALECPITCGDSQGQASALEIKNWICLLDKQQQLKCLSKGWMTKGVSNTAGNYWPKRHLQRWWQFKQAITSFCLWASAWRVLLILVRLILRSG